MSRDEKRTLVRKKQICMCALNGNAPLGHYYYDDDDNYNTQYNLFNGTRQ